MNIDIAISEYKRTHGFGSFAPRAVLFDMDGVIYDSMPNHATAWVQSMSEAKIHMTREDAYLKEGKRGVETIHDLFLEQKGIDLKEEDAQPHYDRKSEIFASLGPTSKMEGVEELMRLIHDDGLLIGVVTGSGQQTLLSRLVNDFPGLLHPDRIVTAMDVTHGKPAPDPYLAGLKKCGVEAHEAIVVENAPLGVTSAVAAKIFTIAVNTSQGNIPDDKLIDAGANLLFNRMTDLRDQWHDLMAAIRR